MGTASTGQHLRQAWRLFTQLPQRSLLALVLVYRWTLKPWLGNACRFEPSCSQYALDALRQHGAVVGASLSTWRLLRCHPWCNGGCDPVPRETPRLFSHLGLRPMAGNTTDEPYTPNPAVQASTTPHPAPSTPSTPTMALEPKPLSAGPGRVVPPSTHSPTIKPLS